MNFKRLLQGAALAALMTANTAAAAPVAGNAPEPDFITDSFDAAISGAEVVFRFNPTKSTRYMPRKALLPISVCSPVKTLLPFPPVIQSAG